MPRRALRAAALPAAITVVLFILGARPTLAHTGEEGSGISIEPPQVTAGGTVVLAGQGLEPNTERQINLVGPDVIVPFPNVTTDADWMFAVTLTVPAFLPGGTYTFQAIGDETLTVECAITAAAGQAAPEPKNEAAAVVTPRERSPVEIVAWVVLVLVTLGAGALLVIRAERLGRLFAR